MVFENVQVRQRLVRLSDTDDSDTLFMCCHGQPPCDHTVTLQSARIKSMHVYTITIAEYCLVFFVVMPNGDGDWCGPINDCVVCYLR